MNFATVALLSSVIGATYHCDCRYVRSVEVQQMYKGRVLWRGTVGIFQLLEHPAETECFAWMSDQFEKASVPVLFLKALSITSATEAVRAYVTLTCPHSWYQSL